MTKVLNAATDLKTVTMEWSDETACSSYFEHLTFPADRMWVSCKVTARGKRGTQKLSVNVTIDGKKSSFTCNNKKTIVKTYEIGGKYCSINITGSLQINPFPPASGSVKVECTYDASQPLLLTKSVTWSDETAGISCIDRLHLSDEYTWEKCDIKINGRKQKITGVMVGLIANNDIKMNPVWRVLNGTDSFVYTVDNIKTKTSLLIPGYITNHAAVAGGGAVITLTGYYFEGDIKNEHNRN